MRKSNGQNLVIDGNWYVLLYGMPKPPESLVLAPGLSLCPIQSKLTVFDLAAAGAVGFRSWAILEPITGGCMCEIETAKDSAISPGYDTLNRAWLATALLVLRGFTKVIGIACSSYSWNTIAGHQARTSDIFKRQLSEEGIDEAVYNTKRSLPPFQGNILDYHTQIITDQYPRKDGLASEDIKWINQYYSTFNKLASDNESFRLALEAAVDWRFSKDFRIAVARIWSGIEAIFGINSELVYRISLLSASLLEQRGQSRIDKFKQVKILYGLRSKAIHGDKITDEKLYAALNESFKLLKDLLLCIIEQGEMFTNKDFEEAMLG